MACKTIYNFPFNSPVAVNDLSQSSILEFRIINCDDNIRYPQTCEESWNLSRCNNDKPYYIPFCESVTGNLLYFQFQFFIPIANRNDGWKLTSEQETYYLDLEILDSCCEIIEGFDPYPNISDANTFRIGDNHFQNLIIDTTLLPDEFIIHVFTSDGKHAYLPAYRRDCCNELFQLEGVFTNYGCDSRYYATPEFVDTGNAFAFRNITTFLGTIVTDSYSLEKVTNRNNVLSVSRTEELQLQTLELPPFAFNNLVETLSAKEIIVTTSNIDSVTYNFAGTIGGRRQTNRMYKPDITLTRIDCEQNLKC